MLQRISDYALLGDCHSAALVGRNGSIDWACFPRFDSPALFCRLLDVKRGGSFGVAPEGRYHSTRRYLDDRCRRWSCRTWRATGARVRCASATGR